MEPHNQVMEHQDTEQEIAWSAKDLNEEDKKECSHCNDISLESTDTPSAKLASFKVFDQEDGSTLAR